MSLRALFVTASLFLFACATDPAPTDGGVDAALDARADAAQIDAARPCNVSADCDDAHYCNGTETCVSGSCRAGTAIHCDDGIACTVDQCIESRQLCQSTPPDADHDGSLDASCHDASGAPLGDDCDDADALRFPGNREVCDATGHDEDCNLTTVGTTDADLDGFISGACCNTGGLCGPDCDDMNLNRRPGAPELCNRIDDDCDMLVDEGLATVGYYPDCDADGYGDASATPMLTCTVPPMAPCPGGQWVMQAGDCADTDPMRHMGATEACNGVDDDCDAMIDDIIHGTVVCSASQTRSCNNMSCGTSGIETCAATCLSWSGRCVAAEICNGCDDDADGAPDNGFTCARGTSAACTVPVCGSSGTQVCGMTCGWGACTGAEVCNYCDDNGNGNFWEERSTAVNTASLNLRGCGADGFYGAATCERDASGNDTDYWATLLDGTANNQAGAFWWTPSAPALTQGWGPTEIQIDMEVRVVSPGPDTMTRISQPLGGWAVVIGHDGSPGVGTPVNRGIPGTVDGVAASWYWSTFYHCAGAAGAPPTDADAYHFTAIHFGAVDDTTVSTAGPSPCPTNGESGAAPALQSGGITAITQHLTLRYTPDDPTLTGNQERVTVIAGTGAGATSHDYIPPAGLSVGTAPLRIGITAGTYTQSGFTMGPGTASVFGVPVHARAHIVHSLIVAGSGPGIFYTDYVTITRAGLCP